MCKIGIYAIIIPHKTMDNPLKDIFSKVKGFGRSGGSSAVGIDIGSSSIKVVEVKKKDGRAMLETYGMIGLGPYADTDVGRVTNLPVEKITEALKETLKQSGVTTTSSAISIS